MIDNDGAARRLARAIAADIQLYNAEKIRAGDDVSDAVAEGRDLFHARVTPEHHRVFEEEWAAMSGAPPPPPTAAAPAEQRFGTFYADARPPAPKGGGSAVLVAFVVVALVAAIGVWILLG